MKSLALILALGFLCLSVSCQSISCKNLDKEKCEALKNFTVFGKNHTARFDHLCSEIQQGTKFRQTWAFFEQLDSNDDYKALALVEIHVGWYGLKQGISLDLHKMKIEGLDDWANDKFFLALKTKEADSRRGALGDFSKVYSYSFSPGGGYPEDRPYQISKSGGFDWERMAEERTGPVNYYKSSDGINIEAARLNSLKAGHQLYLVLKNERTGDLIELKGPSLENLEALLDIEKPEFRALGLAEALNPSDPGGIAAWYMDGWRYRDCIYLRKRAKKEFDERF